VDLEVNHEDPGGTLIEVPDDKEQVAAKPFGECTVEQMRRALQHKRKPQWREGPTHASAGSWPARALGFGEAHLGRALRVGQLLRTSRGG
jgi:hypothetical protein